MHCKTLNSAKVTIWAGLSSKEIIGLFFIRKMINSFHHIEVLQQLIATFQALEGASKRKFMNYARGSNHTVQLQCLSSLKKYFSDQTIVLIYSQVTSIAMDLPPYSPNLNSLTFSFGAI